MPSSYTTRNRFTKQAAGEGNNVWGVVLNEQVFDMVDESMDGWTIKAVTGNITLSSANGSTDEARKRVLKFTGSVAATITCPSVEKWYWVWNASSAAQIITTGAGDSATIGAGQVTAVICDGTNVRQIGVDGDGWKAYVDEQAFAALAGDLPAQTGNANKPLTTDGTTASWGEIAQDHVIDLIADLALKAPLASPGFTGNPTFAAGLTLTGAAKGNVSELTGTSIDVSVAEFFTDSISSNTTYTFTGATSGKAMAFALKLTVSSSATVTFPASVLWAGGTEPTSPGNGTHVFGFLTFDGGTSWIGIFAASTVS